MAHISSGVEYGLHCLLFLVSEAGTARDASVRDLAELQGVPVDFLAKIFTKLAKAGLVAATEGVKGGFMLARPASKISVLDVVHAIDGARELFECREIRARCAVFDGAPPAWATAGTCAVHAVMLDAQQRMEEALAQQSLQDLVERVGRKSPASYDSKVIGWLGERASKRTVKA
ncbi:RrF2 family transcriptional regulator [Pseudoduganella danionis]|uniref:Rrf2 family transcriptional regulator n=1 Tax=Pseudoduganella danionis TaxID=1890295 RepID=A0ABW9SQX8_9BURK|nr:Rrf2 family transcriptional regulator [Pseudoduganella danionis]MTW33087.1 Rrf2 family transcriptional regulator [Pseudoduganella danionis]